MATPAEKKQMPAPIKPNRGKDVDYGTTKPLYRMRWVNRLLYFSQVATLYISLFPPGGHTKYKFIIPRRWRPQLRKNRCLHPLNPVGGRTLIRAIPFKYIREGGRGSPKMFEKKLDTIPRETNAKLYL